MTRDRWPSELRLKGKGRVFAVTFEDGSRIELPAELLRVESPSAEVQGHGPDQKRLVAGKRDVSILAVEPVGSYAVKLTFSDGHATGIFTWPFLDDMGRRQGDMMRDYETRLAAAGLSR